MISRGLFANQLWLSVSAFGHNSEYVRLDQHKECDVYGLSHTSLFLMTPLATAD